MTESQNLKRQIIRATKWSALSELASRAVTPLIFVVLARLLTPEDFGVTAAVAIVISFSQVFWDAGLSKALVQRESEVEAAANVVFWTNAVFGLVIYGVLFAAADVIASLFKDPRVVLVVRVQGMQLILASLGSVHTALYQRAFDFKSLFWVRLLTTTLPALASVPLALLGFSYWALVAGTLTGAAAQMTLLWGLSPWRPRFEYNWTLARQLLRFGLWVTGSGLLAWFYLWVDSLVVGACLDVYGLGLYRTGNAFVIMIFGVIFNPTIPVLFGAFSRMKNIPADFQHLFLKSVKVIAIVALPVGFCVFVLREPLASMVFGNKWAGIGSVIGAMALTHGFAWLVGANPEALRAKGRPDIETKIMGLCFFIYFPIYLFAVRYGLDAFIWARFAVVFLSIIVHLFFSKKYLDYGFTDMYSVVYKIIISVAIVAITTTAMDEFLLKKHADISKISIIVPSFFVLYFVFMIILDKKFVNNDILPIVRQIRA